MVDFLFNKKGEALILHSKPLPEILKWIEYDADTETLTLVMRSGHIQDLGLPVPRKKALPLLDGRDVTVLYLQSGKIADFTIVPLVARGTAIN